MNALLLSLVLAAAPGEPIAVGQPAPALALPNATAAGTVSLKDLTAKNKLTVLMFISTHCPVSNAYNTRMASISAEYAKKGVAFVGVNSNKAEPSEEIAQHAKEHAFSFPVVKDDKNLVADQYGARVTPEIFVVDQKGVVRYHGRIDENQSDPAGVKSPDLKVALDALLAGKNPERSETKAFGCSIKRL